jgi:hypothetical protein
VARAPSRSSAAQPGADLTRHKKRGTYSGDSHNRRRHRGVLLLIAFALAVRVVKQYEQGVLFRLGRLEGSREPGLRLIIPIVD